MMTISCRRSQTKDPVEGNKMPVEFNLAFQFNIEFGYKMKNKQINKQALEKEPVRWGIEQSGPESTAAVANAK